MRLVKKKFLESKNQRGQTLLEFLLLFAMILLISFAVLAVVNGHMANRWKGIGNKILGPTSTTPPKKLEFR